MPIHQNGAQFSELVAIMQRLLAPDGCPWDREQTLDTLKPYLIEEAHEVLEAIEENDIPEHCQELGDVLLQIVFQAEVRAAENSFGIDDVIRAISEKLVRRHPHVFGDVKVEGSGEVVENWSKIKATEHAKKGHVRGPLDGIPQSLPALLQAQRMGEKAARVGFDWPDIAGVRRKIDEELGELDEAIGQQDTQAIAHELGDVLLAMTRLASKLSVAPEDALRSAISRFRKRFQTMCELAQAAGKSETLSGMTLDEMEELWQTAKRAIQASSQVLKK